MSDVNTIAQDYSSTFNTESREAAIILAAGHGKRIKSQRSKMLHEIWGTTTVERVYNACVRAVPGINTILVVGIKAPEVMRVVGKRPNNQFAYQADQKGTGHAVQVALEKITADDWSGIVYVLPGDMGLIDEPTISEFRTRFLESGSDMSVLTGLFEGKVEDNYYGRIIRVKEFDTEGNSSGSDKDNVIEIMEHKDILALQQDTPYICSYKGRKYSYTREELINTREYNSGVYAFDYKKLQHLAGTISSNNAQGEVYITDLIGLFNQSGYTVSASSPKEEYVVMGFNDKSVLKEMATIFRRNVYEQIKNIIEIDDPDDFFIEESVITDILEMDKKGIPLDIQIGKGVHIGKGVKLNYNLRLKKNVYIDGNVKFGKNVIIWENVHLSCYPDQELVLGDGVEILWGNIVKGNIVLGDNCRIESSVNMTGSNDHPLRLGKNVLIKGTSYLFGTIVADDIVIEHSVLISKQVNQLRKSNGELQRVRFFLPLPSGIDAIESLR